MKSITKVMVVTVAMLLAAALLVAPAAARTDATTIEAGDIIYVGESGLTFPEDVTRLVQFDGETIVNVIVITEDFELTAGDVAGYTGAYQMTGDDLEPVGDVVLIRDPDATLDVRVGTDSIDGKTVSRGSTIYFRLSNNFGGLYPGVAGNADFEPLNYQVTVTTPTGGRVTTLNNEPLNIPINDTRARTGDIPLEGLAPGTYTAFAEPVDDQIDDFPDTNTVSFTIGARLVALDITADSVVRNNNFAVTITGESRGDYLLYVRKVSGLGDDEYPQIVEGQTSVTTPADNIFGRTDVSPTNAIVELNAAGTRTVEFSTSDSTDARTYTIYVREADEETEATRFDSVRVRVEEGAVTILAEGTGVYYMGEEILLTGTNTDSDRVYLFMTGSGLNRGGVSLLDTGETDPEEFPSADVDIDDTWEFRWRTSEIGGALLDAGSYTIYAVSGPVNRDNLDDVQYASAGISLRQGFISATVSPATLARGDELVISGTAQGNPDEIFIWVFGTNYRDYQVAVVVEDDGTFEHTISRSETEDLAAGQFFVVAQHPMGDGDVNPVHEDGGVISVPGGGVAYLANLQAPMAAQALVDALNSRYTDDTYTQLTFLVEEAWVRIDAVGDQQVGTTFEITGTTNLAAGNTLTVDVVSASFRPADKTAPEAFAGASGTVEVMEDDLVNTWSFTVDATDFRPDQYIVNVESVETAVTATTTFNLVEGEPTPTPTPTAEPGEETPTPTPTPTAEPTPTPGFGALIALIGLGAVAFLVLRRR